VKDLLLLVVLVVLVWHWRTNRKADIAQRQHNPSPANLIDMVECAHCHLHLAAADAVSGPKGHYCSPEHRSLAER
jgi:uncharacterized protein